MKKISIWLSYNNWISLKFQYTENYWSLIFLLSFLYKSHINHDFSLLHAGTSNFISFIHKIQSFKAYALMNIIMQIRTSAFILFSVCTETLSSLMYKGNYITFSALRVLAFCASKPKLMPFVHQHTCWLHIW